MELVILLVSLTTVLTQTRLDDPDFRITSVSVPKHIDPGEQAELECRYVADFTSVKWFKDRHEFYRYNPSRTPSIMVFPSLGIGEVETLYCNKTQCKIILSDLSEEASGKYTCDVEFMNGTHRISEKYGYMKVKGVVIHRPTIVGVMSSYEQGDIVTAECHGRHTSEFKWYLNSDYIKSTMVASGISRMRVIAHRLMFYGIDPMLSVQCAEFTADGRKLLGSTIVKSRWCPGVCEQRTEIISSGASHLIYERARVACLILLFNFLLL